MLRRAAKSSSTFVIALLDSLLFREALSPSHTLRQKGDPPFGNPLLACFAFFCFNPDPEERRSLLRLYGF